MIDDGVPFAAEGGCACGSVRFRLASRPIITHGCHCKFCQRMSGSAFAVNAMIETDRLVFLRDGRPEAIHTPSALPAGQKVARCPRCQCALWSHHSELGEAIALVNVGVLDEAGSIAPDVHCYTSRKHPWVTIPPDVPQFAEDYDASVVWSEEVMRRVSAARR